MDQKKPSTLTQTKARRRRCENATDSVIAIFKRLAMERVRLTIDGRRLKVPRAEAILLKNYNAALRGDKSARNNLWRLLERSGELIDRNDPAITGKPIVVPEKICDTDELLELYGVGIVEGKPSRTT